MAERRVPKSWVPPDYPPTTIENDGTLVNRYDVRKTLAYLTNDLNNVNNVFMLYWITTKTGEKFHICTNAGMRGKEMVGSFLSLNDLQNSTARGASVLQPGSGNSKHIQVQSDVQSIISPDYGDRWTNTRHVLELVGVRLETLLQPTGGNFYYGGSGGIQLTTRGLDPDYSTTLPGWSWYWANPTTRVNGTLSINGKTYMIDRDKSFALFERQWGNFHIGKGYYAVWLYFETGEVLISWSMEPALDGTAKTAFASIWHPSGLHEMIPVGSKTSASEISTGLTGVKYFNRFFLDLPARQASFTFDKWVRDAELAPLHDQSYITISESYVEGTGRWNGKDIKVQGHVEQLSTLR